MFDRRLPHVLAFLLLLGGSVALWAVEGPPAGAGIPYQGRLEFGGVPYHGPIDMRVEVYDAATGGALLHEQDFSDVQVNNGAFSVVIAAGALPEALLGSDQVFSRWPWAIRWCRSPDGNSCTPLCKRKPPDTRLTS